MRTFTVCQVMGMVVARSSRSLRSRHGRNDGKSLVDEGSMLYGWTGGPNPGCARTRARQLYKSQKCDARLNIGRLEHQPLQNLRFVIGIARQESGSFGEI